MDLNKVMIIGRLTRDPELRTTPQGKNVTSFSLATNRTWNDTTGNKQEQVEFHNIVAWGKLAEIINQYMSKGRRLYIEGRLQTREWQDKKDGSKKTRTEIVAENMIMLDSKGAGGSNTNENIKSSPLTETDNQEPTVEDIPF